MFSSRQTVLYVRFKPCWLSVRIVRNGTFVNEFEDTAQVAVRYKSGREEVIAVGRDAAATAKLDTGILLYTAFDHPRVVFGKFEETACVLGQFIRRVHDSKTQIFRPRVIMHPLAAFEGGLSDIEIRGLRELGLKMGAKEVVVSQAARELSDYEVQNYQTGNELKE